MDLASKLERLDISMTKKKPEDIKPPAGPIKSVQFDLFSQFVTNDLSEVSNTAEYWENIPKYFFTPTQIKKIRTTDGLAQPQKLPYTLRGREGQPVAYEVEIAPALIEQPDGNYKAFFPTQSEELIEEVLKKIFSDQNYGRHTPEENESWVRFSYNMIRRELKNIGHSRTFSEIKHNLEVMKKCRITVSENGTEIYSEPILPTYIGVNRKQYLDDRDAMHVARLPVLISRAVNSLQYRQFNYKRFGDCKEQLTRYLYKRFVNRFVYANYTNTYNFMYSDIKQASGLLRQGREADNRIKLKSALNELIDRGVLLKYEIEEQKEGRKIFDIKYTVTASPDFVGEQKAANKRRKNSEMRALGAGVSLVDNSH